MIFYTGATIRTKKNEPERKTQTHSNINTHTDTHTT